ncbi:hypothetical protein COOONC_15318 [Cooperia oncophora]
MPQDEVKSESTGDTGDETFEDEDVNPYRTYGTTTNGFDGDHRRYKCCCGHIHAMTGMQIIVALLSITVFFDMWQVIGGAAANTQFDRGLPIHYKVQALQQEWCFSVAFLYISLFGDRSTAVSFLRSNGHLIHSPDDAQLSELISFIVALALLFGPKASRGASCCTL